MEARRKQSIKTAVVHTFCECCRNTMKGNESRVPITKKTSEIFCRLIGYKLLNQDGVLCSKCNVHLLTFEVFCTDVSKKHYFLNLQPTVHTKNLLVQPFSTQKRLHNVNETLTDTNTKNFKRIILNGPVKTKVIPKFLVFPKFDRILAQENEQFKNKQNKVVQKLLPRPLNMKRVVVPQQEESPVSIRELSPVNIKVEPQDKIIIQTTFKTEPIDSDDQHMPELPLTTENDFDMYENLQNFLIKDEYEIEDEGMIVEEAPMDEADIERQALLESFSTQKSLVIKSNIKKKIDKKKMKEQRRKTLAISIPEDATVVEEFVMTETSPEFETESKSSNLLEAPKTDNQHRYTRFKCEHCSVVNRSRTLVIRHIKEMHAFKCTICHLIFPTNQQLANHQENKHNMSSCKDGGRRKQKLSAKKEEVPPAFRLIHT